VRSLTSREAELTLAVSCASAWKARITGRARTRSTKRPESLASASNCRLASAPAAPPARAMIARRGPGSQAECRRRRASQGDGDGDQQRPDPSSRLTAELAEISIDASTSSTAAPVASPIEAVSPRARASTTPKASRRKADLILRHVAPRAGNRPGAKRAHDQSGAKSKQGKATGDTSKPP